MREGLGDLGAGLHPAFDPVGAPESAAGAVLFLCSANSARSQMAEALSPELPGSALIHWNRPDPAAVSGPLKARRRAFEAAADEIVERIEGLYTSITSAQPA
ncbi:MAG: hypothetical protein NVS3B24_06640 [Candidatus Dormibacteria bacterium]